MPSCTFNRVCSRDTSTSNPKYASRMIEDPATGEIMMAFLDMGNGGGSPQSVRFVRFDPVTLLPNSEVPIKSDYTFNNNVGAIDMVRLTNGDLVVTWYSHTTVAPTGNTTSYSKSSDGGATWSAAANVAGVNQFPVGLCTDGTSVWQFTVGLSTGGSPAGASTGDLVAFKYNGTSWDGGTIIYNSGGSGGTPESASTTQVAQAHLSAQMASSTSGLLVFWRGVDAPPTDSRKLSCLTTADGWASDLTSSVVDLQTFTASGGGNAINTVRLSGGRVYLQSHNPDANQKIRLYYTDNVGAAWTTIGTPTAYDTWLTGLGIGGDESYDAFLCLDELENLIFGQSSEQILNPGTHAPFRSSAPTTTAGWAQVGECTYANTPDTIQSATAGRGIIIDDTLYRLVGMTRASGGAHFTLEILAVEGAGLQEEPEQPPTTTEATLVGAEANNQMARIDLARGGGWSLHEFGAACAMSWEEGDEETGVEVPIRVAASPSMDPAIESPENLAALTRFETGRDFGFGRRYSTASTAVVNKTVSVVINSPTNFVGVLGGVLDLIDVPTRGLAHDGDATYIANSGLGVPTQTMRFENLAGLPASGVTLHIVARKLIGGAVTLDWNISSAGGAAFRTGSQVLTTSYVDLAIALTPADLAAWSADLADARVNVSRAATGSFDDFRVTAVWLSWSPPETEPIVIIDPLRTIWKSKRYVITKDEEINVGRGVLVNYEKHGAGPLPLSVLIDGTVVRVIQMPTSWGVPVRKFFALPRQLNAGSQVQFMIDETSLDFWALDSCKLKYIPKGTRGRG